jgi:phage baseplate assembly protein V
MSELFDALFPDATSRRTRINGVATAIVTNNQDPDGMGRVKLRFPWLSKENESDWTRIAVPMGGAAMGSYFLPEVDDQVLVAFEQGDRDRPFVLGTLWSKNAKPPEKNDDGKNNMRTIKSRSGHIVRLDDTDGAEKIQVLDRTGKNKIEIDSKANTITITSDADLTIESTTGKLVLKGKTGVEITSGADVKADATGNVAVTAKAKMDLTASGPATVKGAVINLN